ncbi:chromosome segregation protein SMC [Aliiglaciecola litoralis]|uniref:Chromosome partition protein Smc n=1 Tax=Aliiglaciecola litoralis TaxID=582857 RepID=A0ABN1LCN3_9ALTE
MRLKKIRLAGFKSFVDPTNIPFPDDMTAIVGPNGCGKSNVIDAVRWVLGESSAKNLRGDAMTDVIFNGSTARKPVSQCSVELVFDNSSGRIQGEFANYAELSVKRVVTRDAQSNYYLNATKCRRRDVTDIFLGTGLGPRSYAIIEQGMISRLIESKPQELRVFIEEAAGISKYKERRRETENRIRHTNDNLERLEDVRAELGQQIEKLQRQATAARKYKDLKAKERRLKAELAAIRWLKHSEHLAQLESQIQQQENDIEAFVAQQRGDEKGITLYKEQQQNLKQQLSDVQHQMFTVGTEITKLEQNRLHAKQRESQIEQELTEVISSQKDSQEFEKQEEQRLKELAERLAAGEPQMETLQAQLLVAQEASYDIQQAMLELDSQWREHDQQYQLCKQQVQSCHSQIQATVNMQMRTQQRISEIQQEQGELEQDVLAQQIDSLEHQVAQAKGRFTHAKQHLESEQQKLRDQLKLKTSLNQRQFEAKGEIQKLSAQLAALESLQAGAPSQDTLSDYLQSQNLEFAPVWKVLQVAPGWEKAVAAATRGWQQGLWIKQASLTQFEEVELTGKVLIEAHMSAVKPKGSLAEKIVNDRVPAWFTATLIADDWAEAVSLLPKLKDNQQIVTKNGDCLGADWIDWGGQSSENGLIERAATMSQLAASKQQQIAQLEQQIEHPLAQLEQQITKSEGVVASCQADYKQAEQALTQQQNQLNLLEMQHQQTLVRQTKLSEELARQTQLLEDERMQSEQLAEQVQELELRLEEMQGKQQEFETKKVAWQQKDSEMKHKVEQYTAESHQLALTLQDVKSQYHALVETAKRTQQMLQSLAARKHQLEAEKAQLSEPFEQQASRLAELLEQRAQLEIQQTSVSEQLAEVQELLTNAEKGQQGVTEKIQQMRTELQSSKLECEGYRVRANSTLEQLDEQNLSLKTILASLPEQTDEVSWQQQLENTAASISRLGAVNLAAVEEYEIQSQRKQHLDAQNDDLVAALDTLESAIRKIDKETRSRFKDTYDRVNQDLKELFPKVFGGGSAYLELTGEDLLETGVTIMARPPGKKNSTIHLLSGGEKALTALSLVFAIFRLNPAPFCLLDEVDAPLDDANVGRFCKLVSEMSKTVQFIYITHNKIAMEMAKHLTGVTMAEPGVSRMVSVDVEEAVAIAQA